MDYFKATNAARKRQADLLLIQRRISYSTEAKGD